MTIRTALYIAAALLVSLPGLGQTPRTSTPQAPLAIPNPHYASIVMEVNVARPAAEVWQRVGKYCGIGEWMRLSCTILSG